MSDSNNEEFLTLLTNAREAFDKNDFPTSQRFYDDLFVSTSGLLKCDDYRRHAYCLIENGEFEKAQSAIEAWETLDGNDPVLYSMKGHVLRKLAKFTEAELALKRSLALKPRASGYCVLGDLLANMGHSEQAAASYRMALAIDPSYDEARENLERLTGKQ